MLLWLVGKSLWRKQANKPSDTGCRTGDGKGKKAILTSSTFDLQHESIIASNPHEHSPFLKGERRDV